MTLGSRGIDQSILNADAATVGRKAESKRENITLNIKPRKLTAPAIEQNPWVKVPRIWPYRIVVADRSKSVIGDRHIAGAAIHLDGVGAQSSAARLKQRAPKIVQKIITHQDPVARA
jgi:hypothetical protein